MLREVVLTLEAEAKKVALVVNKSKRKYLKMSAAGSRRRVLELRVG